MIACVFIPDFAVIVERNLNPALNDAPLIVLRHTGQKAKVYAACGVALSMGIKVGMFSSRALALCPEAQVVSANQSLYRRVGQQLLDILLAFTGRIELEQTHSLTIWLDVGNLPQSEISHIGSKILQIVADKTPFLASVGIANGKFTARIAATKARIKSVAIVPIGRETSYLSSFSVQNLALSKELSRQFDLLGIVTLGQFATLPYGAVLDRFGKVGGLLHRLATGQDIKSLAHYTSPKSEQVAHSFEASIEDRTIVQSVFTQLTCKLATRLNEQGLAASELTLIVHCENARVLETSLRLRQPITGALSLLRAVDRLFAGLSIGTGITGIEIHLDNLQALAPQQLDFFGQLMGTSYSVPELVKRLQPRHSDAPFHTIVANKYPGHLPERRFRIESVDVA